MSADHVQVGWKCEVRARFWEPGTEEHVRRKLYLPAGAHVSAAMLDRLKVRPFRVAEGPTPGNRLTSAGLAAMTSQWISGTKDWAVSSGGSGWTGLAVGNGTTADAIGDTDLVGATKSYRVCDNGFPKRVGATSSGTGAVLTSGQFELGATFASGEANHAWDEYGGLVPNSSASAATGAATTSKAAFGGGNYILLNRKAPAGLGTKTAGSPAELYMVLTIS